jgi:hypothetical protein
MRLYPTADIPPLANSPQNVGLKALGLHFPALSLPVSRRSSFSTNYVPDLYDNMKDLISILLLCAASVVVGDVVKVKRQSTSSSAAVVASSSTSSVFSVPTPSSLPTVNSSQYDMSKHFCRIWRHQSKPVELKCESSCAD